MQPPADNPAAVNPNILATPAGVNLHGARQSAQGIRLQPPADNPAAVNPNILATPAGVLSLARASISARNPVATPR